MNIIPVNVKYHDEYCNKILQLLLDCDIRASYDNSKERMSKKLQESINMKNPITVIIGDNERDNNKVSFRKLGSEENISLPLEDFINEIKKSIRQR